MCDSGIKLMSPMLVFCTFLIDSQLFGTPVSNVQEVMPHRPMTPVPLAPEVVKGLLNLRGELVTSIDLRLRLGLQNTLVGRLPMNVVVHTADGPVSLAVDEIGDVVEVNDSMCEKVPETLQGPARGFMRGVYKLPDRLLLALDIERIVDFSLMSAPSDPKVAS
jgi:purine-binding chemotaxis protein CheW